MVHLFEPLWRKDKARSDAAHSGLGLALVKALAKLLEMDVRAKLTDSNTVEISVKIPKARKIGRHHAA